MKAYDVMIDDVWIGYIFRVVKNTDRPAGRLRIPGKGRLAWGWRLVGGSYNPPGLYESSRDRAVKRMIETREEAIRDGC
jgi:hypothetical protein